MINNLDKHIGEVLFNAFSRRGAQYFLNESDLRTNIVIELHKYFVNLDTESRYQVFCEFPYPEGLNQKVDILILKNEDEGAAIELKYYFKTPRIKNSFFEKYGFKREEPNRKEVVEDISKLENFNIDEVKGEIYRYHLTLCSLEKSKELENFINKNCKAKEIISKCFYCLPTMSAEKAHENGVSDIEVIKESFRTVFSELHDEKDADPKSIQNMKKLIDVIDEDWLELYNVFDKYFQTEKKDELETKISSLFIGENSIYSYMKFKKSDLSYLKTLAKNLTASGSASERVSSYNLIVSTIDDLDAKEHFKGLVRDERKFQHFYADLLRLKNRRCWYDGLEENLNDLYDTNFTKRDVGKILKYYQDHELRFSRSSISYLLVQV